MMIAGIVLLILNVFTAAFAPYLAWHDPIRDMQVADDYALPAWMAIFPHARELPRNILKEIKYKDWIFMSTGGLANHLTTLAHSENFTISYRRMGLQASGEAQVIMKYRFEYPYTPPKTFAVYIPINITFTGLESVQYRLAVLLKGEGRDKPYTLHDSYPPWRSTNFIRWGEKPLTLHSRDIKVAASMGINPLYENPAEVVFNKRGLYELIITLYLRDRGDSDKLGKLEATFGIISLKIPGLLYGVLGTNMLGADIFSQLIYGARISLMIGVSAAILIVALGLLVGIIAGYFGGFIDQMLMFNTDLLMQIPNLPIILMVMLVFGRNIYIIVFIIALLSWMGVARQLRAWTLSLKEAAYVEASRAAGATDFYIIFKVVAPQLVPIIAYFLAMTVPFAVFLEAGLSLLGFGDPFFPSWGKMLNEAYYFGGFSKLAWWWIAPPITAILILALSFVLIGYSLEEVFHPRLRRR